MSTARATFVPLYNEHFDEVHAFCARRVGRSDADDVAAEVFAVAWRRIDDVDPTAERAWLFGVARRVVLNQWRSTSRRSITFEDGLLVLWSETRQNFDTLYRAQIRTFTAWVNQNRPEVGELRPIIPLGWITTEGIAEEIASLVSEWAASRGVTLEE